MLDCTQISFEQMADMIRAMKQETMKRLEGTNARPNLQHFNDLILDLEELAE